MSTATDNFISFERAVMENTFLGSEKNAEYIRYESSELSKNECVDKIKKQYEKATVVSREFTGKGFFTNFFVADNSLHLDRAANFEMGCIHAEIAGLEHGAMFILWIRNGVLSVLEGVSCGDEGWPEHITEYKLNYVNSSGSLTAL